MTEDDVRTWFAHYLSAFEELGRGQASPADLAAFYAGPLLVTTDDVLSRLPSPDAIATWLAGQADAMSSAGYDHTQLRTTAVTVLNRRTAMVRAVMTRRRGDGAEIATKEVTYTHGRDQDELRVAAVAVHSA